MVKTTVLAVFIAVLILGGYLMVRSVGSAVVHRNAAIDQILSGK